MQRVSAIVLISIIGFWLGAPGFAGRAELQLPACCRMNGKHKCAMQFQHSSTAEASTPSVQSLAPKCPFFPAGGSMLLSGSEPMLPEARNCFGSLSSYPAVQAQAEALFRISFARARQKRGPPALLS